MNQFSLHTISSAPPASRPHLEKAATLFGFVPGLLAGLAESPAALEGYLRLAAALEHSSLSRIEQQVVLLAVSVENGCEFCVGAHSYIARHMAKMGAQDIEALRTGSALSDSRLDALARLARTIVQQRGWVDPGELDEFLAAGFSRAQVLDVVLGVAMKTLSNYANHILDTPLDAAFESERWYRAA